MIKKSGKSDIYRRDKNEGLKDEFSGMETEERNTALSEDSSAAARNAVKTGAEVFATRETRKIIFFEILIRFIVVDKLTK